MSTVKTELFGFKHAFGSIYKLKHPETKPAYFCGKLEARVKKLINVNKQYIAHPSKESSELSTCLIDP